MLDAIETYLALRRTTGFAMSTAEYLLKSFAAFAAERGQTYVETKTAIDWAALGPSVAQRAANRTVYCMTKHAVEGLTKAMAIELSPHRIRVNSVGPTLVDTPLARRIVDTPEKRAYFESRIPLGTLASIEDIMAATVYLASPAAAMVTGAHLLVDGGWTAQ